MGADLGVGFASTRPGIGYRAEVRREFAEEIGLQPDEPFLPLGSIVQRGGKLGLFIVENEQARFMALPDALEGLAAIIELPPGTIVITSSLAGLKDGTKVRTAP